MKISTKNLVYCALFTALTAVCSQIAIPLPMGVPINLATFSVLLSGALLGGVGGALSQFVYVLMGAVGLPVFAMLRGGFDRLAGPTGGYIVGYIFAALAVGLVVQKLKGKYWVTVLGMVLGAVIYYTLGTAWYMLSGGVRLVPALTGCVLPFLPGDAIKILLAAYCSVKLRPVMKLTGAPVRAVQE